MDCELSLSFVVPEVWLAGVVLTGCEGAVPVGGGAVVGVCTDTGVGSAAGVGVGVRGGGWETGVAGGDPVTEAG